MKHSSKSRRRRDAKPNSLSAQAQRESRTSAFSKVRNVLVGVDFSDFSLQALHYAVGLATELGASLTVLHVVPADYGLLNIGKEASRDLDEALQSQAAANLQRLAAKEIGDARSVELEVRLGRPAEEIIAGAAESKCDLIVLSTHGYSGLDHILIGSVAERVVRLAPCPVLVVRGRNPPSEQREIQPVVLRLGHKTKRGK
jgi:nucleotide-binding universal stress UspA family protein